jgi:hypothetical protein
MPKENSLNKKSGTKRDVSGGLPLFIHQYWDLLPLEGKVDNFSAPGGN